jgi:hypothetical protein
LTNTNPKRQFRRDFCYSNRRQAAGRGLSREAPAMSVPSEPFAAVYEDRNRLGVIVARTGRGGFEAFAADDHCLGLFRTPREAAAAITTTRPWVAQPIEGVSRPESHMLPNAEIVQC